MQRPVVVAAHLAGDLSGLQRDVARLDQPQRGEAGAGAEHRPAGQLQHALPVPLGLADRRRRHRLTIDSARVGNPGGVGTPERDRGPGQVAAAADHRHELEVSCALGDRHRPEGSGLAAAGDLHPAQAHIDRELVEREPGGARELVGLAERFPLRKLAGNLSRDQDRPVRPGPDLSPSPSRRPAHRAPSGALGSPRAACRCRRRRGPRRTPSARGPPRRGASGPGPAPSPRAAPAATGRRPSNRTFNLLDGL